MKSEEINSRRKFLGKLGAGSFLFGAGSMISASGADTLESIVDGKSVVYDPYNFGAKGDGKTIDTKAIQAAIDICHKNNGGKVVLHSGTFLSGTIILKSNVCLHVESGATLLGSPELKDYPDITPEIVYLYTHRFTRYLIYAEKANNISITGRGVIDGNGRVFPYIRNEDKNRPYIIRFAECTNVRVSEITFLDSARWLQHYLACENVVVDGITVISRTRENRDGIDIDSCHNFRLANSFIDSGDDAIVLKATAMRPCKNITVNNCTITSRTAALKLGTESNGGYENILFSNCVIFSNPGEFVLGDAIAIEMVDGGKFDKITVSNIVIHNARNAIFVRLGNRANQIPGLPKPGIGSMSNIMINNIQATEISNIGCSITGLPDNFVENVSLNNIRIQFKGGGSSENTKFIVPERPAAYPSGRMYGILPVYGFFCRHVKNLNFSNIQIDYMEKDTRPALLCENIHRLSLTNFNAKTCVDAGFYMVFNQVKDSFITGCRPEGKTQVFLKVLDNATENISLYANDTSKFQEIVNASETVKLTIKGV